jgi:Tfp pilus assembly PilM family ATPase
MPMPGMGGTKARTGIDLGTTSVKLVRGVGGAGLERATHVGVEDWDPPAEGLADDVRAAGALSRLLDRLGLSRRSLGRVAVAIGGDAVSVREVSMPVLSERDLRRALPFEAKKHLFLDGMESPCFDFQILGHMRGGGDEAQEEMRVLLVAAPRPVRDFPIRVLGRVGIEPEVVDLEQLAGLNALLATHPFPSSEDANESGYGFLDLGADQARLHLVHPEGGFLTRSVAAGAYSNGRAELQGSLTELSGRIRETITFYRGRYRRGVKAIYLAGGGAALKGLPEGLEQILGLPVATLNPLQGIAGSARGVEAVAAAGPRFVTALGLCRWWDGQDV